jgi:hypothetical protein
VFARVLCEGEQIKTIAWLIFQLTAGINHKGGTYAQNHGAAALTLAAIAPAWSNEADWNCDMR